MLYEQLKYSDAVNGGYDVQPTPIHTSIVHDIGLNKIDALITFY